MRPITRGGIVALAALLVMGVTTSAGATHKDDTLIPGQPVYLTLGDSWAWGQGAADPGSGGYAALLAGILRTELDCSPARSANAVDGCKHLQQLNLARPATDTLPGVTAPIVLDEQLPVAVPLLEERNNNKNPSDDVEAITLHVGGNDVSGPIQAACIGGIDPTCIGTWITEMSVFEQDLRDVMEPLREAAGDDTPIVLGTYDNPVPTCFLDAFPGAATLGALLLEGTPIGYPISLDGVHDVVRRVAADYDADVAEVYGTLAPSDFVGGADCLHITDSGHQKVASVFANLLAS